MFPFRSLRGVSSPAVSIHKVIRVSGAVRYVVRYRDPDGVHRSRACPTRKDAERYQREQYKSVRETLQHLLEGDPVVRTFDVHTSTGHKITAGKAA